MQFGIGVAPYARWRDLDELTAVVEAADRLGYDHVGLPDHVVVPAGPEQPRSGIVFPDVFVLAAHLAARTARIRFVFTALVVPLRHPLLTATQLATLDQTSGGRVGVVVGAGWLASEFAAMGVPFDERGPITDEYLRVMKAVWTEDLPSFSGRYVSFPPSYAEPRCVQQPHVPLWVGGTGAAPFRRVVELGDGWAPMTGTFDERARDVAVLKERAAAAGRDPAALAFVGSLAVGQPDAATAKLAFGHHSTARDRADADARRAAGASEAIDVVGRSADAGFTHLSVSLGWEDPAQYVERLEWFAAEVVGPARA